MSWLITPSQPVPLDPSRSNVSLLLHCNGANGSTTITDSSPRPKTIIAFNGAALSTSQSKFGGASIRLNGINDYFNTPNSSEFNFGTDPFTAECWVYFNNNTARQVVFSYYQDSNTGWNVQIFNGKIIVNLSGDGIDITGSSTLAANTWHHIAVSGTSGASGIRLFVNGTQEGSTWTGATALNSTAAFGMGQILGALFLDGFIDEVRITKGVARYTANFTPPTAPFPDI